MKYQPIKLLFAYGVSGGFLTLIYLMIILIFPENKLFQLSEHALIFSFGGFLALGALLSCVSTYLAIDREILRFMPLRILITFLLIVFGGMVFDILYSEVLGTIPVEMFDAGVRWVRGTNFGDFLIGSAVKTSVVVLAFYFYLSCMFAVIPLCAILLSTLIGTCLSRVRSQYCSRR